jgi:hypothetical protein
MKLHDILIERILCTMTEADLAQHSLRSSDLPDLSDLDLFELYEAHVFEELLK